VIACGSKVPIFLDKIRLREYTEFVLGKTGESLRRKALGPVKW